MAEFDSKKVNEIKKFANHIKVLKKNFKNSDKNIY